MILPIADEPSEGEGAETDDDDGDHRDDDVRQHPSPPYIKYLSRGPCSRQSAARIHKKGACAPSGLGPFSLPRQHMPRKPDRYFPAFSNHKSPVPSMSSERPTHCTDTRARLWRIPLRAEDDQLPVCDNPGRAGMMRAAGTGRAGICSDEG